MTDYKDLLGYLSVAISFISYAIYFWAIYRGKAKPHAFTWFVWGILNTIAFAAVIISGGETGAWVLAVNAVANLTIAGIALRQRHVQYDSYDWAALAGGLLGGLLWWQTRDPLYAIILISISDSIAIIPTLRKAYKFPNEENAGTFIVGIIYYIFALFALEHFSLTTSLYHFAIIFADTALILVILIRRQQLNK